MPRYFFNIHNGERSSTDDEGEDLPDDAAARREAIQALAEIGRDEIPADGDRTNIAIHVTDEAGQPLFVVRIDFHVDAVKKKLGA